MFTGNPEAREQFVNKLVRESKINMNVQKVTGGSNTADKAVDANDIMNTMENLAIISNQPTSSAGVRAGGNLGMKAWDLLTNPTSSQARIMGNKLLETNPNKQLELLELMKELQRKQAVSGTRYGRTDQGAIRGGLTGIESY